MDFRSPPAVIEALQQRVAHGVFGYTHAPSELMDTVLTMLADKYGWLVQPEWLVWLPGLVTGLNVVCRAAAPHPTDEIITLVPVYPPFLSAPELAERKLATVPLANIAGRWRIDLNLFEEAITPQTRLLLLCNPHNPVGRIFNREELLALAGICEKHDIIICSDEIHSELVLDEDKQHIPLATLGEDLARRVITFMAPSKTYNLPGLGLSFAVISDTALRQQFQRTMAGIVPYVNALGYTAALAAYRDSHEWHRQLLRYLRGNRDLVTEAVAAMPGLTMTHVEATYLAWIDTRPLGLDNPGRFFEQAGVGLSDGKEFGGDGFVRLNFGCPRATLKEALARMDAATERLQDTFRIYGASDGSRAKNSDCGE